MKRLKRAIVFIFTLLVLAIFMMPFLILIINTFKSTAEFIKTPFSFPTKFTLDNYILAIKRMNFWVAMINTIIITVNTVLINMIVGSMTGYLFARKKWMINKIIFAMFLAFMVAPFQVYMIPLVQIYAGNFGLSNNLFVVTYIAVGLNLPFAVFLYKGFIEDISEQLDDAARIDGCSFELIYVRIILPLLKPIIVTVTVFVALGVWNDYLMSSLFLTKAQNKTLAIAVKTFLTNHSAEYSPMMAGLFLGILPIIAFYLFGQKYIIEGVVAGSVKG